jgi:hypothetical protein
VRGLEERAEIGVRRNLPGLDQLRRALEQRFFGDVPADEGQRGELLQRA